MTNPGGLPRSEVLNIEYDLDALARIEQEVTNAANSPEGALEVAGILLGSYTGRCVRITGFEGLETPLDERLLVDRIRYHDTRARTIGQRVIGWYHSQPNGGLAMSDADTAFHDRYFPEAWQVSLILLPNPSGGMDAKFFLKERSATATPIDGPLQNEPKASEDEPLYRAPSESGRSRRGGGRRSTPVPEASSGRNEISAGPYQQNAAPAAPARKSDAHRRMQWRGWGVWAGLAAMAILSLAGMTYLRTYYSPASGRSRATGLVTLEAVHRNGNIEVTWDPATLHDAAQGHLDVQDGGIRAEVLLDRNTLATGKFSYAVKSDVTEFRLRVENFDGSALAGSTTYVAPNGSGVLAATSLPKLPAPPLPDTRGFRERARDLLKDSLQREPQKEERAAKPKRIFQAPATRPFEPPKQAEADRMKLVEPPAVQPSLAQAQAGVPPPVLFTQPVQTIPPPQARVVLPPPPPVTTPVVKPQPQSQTNQIAGRWTLQPGSPSRSPAVPESIAINVAENNGEFEGTLDARYRSGSKKEHLNFSFAGKAGKGPVRLPWTSGDGQTGHIEFLRVPNSNNIEVVWYGSDSKRVFDEIVRKSN